MRVDPRRVFTRFLRRLAAPQGFVNAQQLPVVIPKDFMAAARSLVDPKGMKYGYVRKQTAQAHNYKRAHPKIVDFAKAFQKEMNRRHIPFRPFVFYRGAAEQRRVKERGFSNASPGQSPHQYGCAVDMISATKTWDLTDRQWLVVREIGMEIARKRKIAIRWGGDWDGDGTHVKVDPDENFWDPAHWELEDWRDYRAADIALRNAGRNLDAYDDASYFGALEDFIRPPKAR